MYRIHVTPLFPSQSTFSKDKTLDGNDRVNCLDLRTITGYFHVDKSGGWVRNDPFDCQSGSTRALWQSIERRDACN
jgi:hypothetical protein